MDFEEKVSPERMDEIRKRCRQMPSATQEERSKALAGEFTEVNQRTLKDYCSVVTGCTDKVWDIFMAGKIKPSIVREIYSMGSEDQNGLVDVCVEKALSRSIVKNVRHFIKDLRMKLPEAISRAVRESEENRSIGAEKRIETLRTKGRLKNFKPSSDSKLTPEIGLEMRKKFRMAIGKTHQERAKMFHKDYPLFTERTLEGYSRVCNNCSEKVWNFLIDGKISLTTCEEMTDWETADQDKIIDECQARGIKLSVYQMRAFKKGGTLAGIEQVFAVPDPPPAPVVAAAPSPTPQESPSLPEEPADPDRELLPGESKFTKEQVFELRSRFREMPQEMSHEARAAMIAKDYPGVSEHTLDEYSRVSLQGTEKVWQLYGEGKTTFGIMSEICAFDPKEQDFLIDEIIEKKLRPVDIRKARRFRKERGWGWPECIAKATGRVPVNQPRKETGHQKSFDSLLDEIAAKGARWRAMVIQAIEMADNLEMESGFHEALFAKVYVLRELVGNQYDLVNNRLQRLMNMFKKNAQRKPEDKDEILEAQDVKVIEPAQDAIETSQDEADGEAASPDITPIPEAEQRSFKDRAAKHEGMAGDNRD